MSMTPRTALRVAIIVCVLCSVVAISSFVVARVYGGSDLLFMLFFGSSLLAVGSANIVITYFPKK